MIDSEISSDIEKMQDYVDGINFLLKGLHEKNVEVRIAYKDSVKDNPPSIELWRAVEHVNYLRKENNE